MAGATVDVGAAVVVGAVFSMLRAWLFTVAGERGPSASREIGRCDVGVHAG